MDDRRLASMTGFPFEPKLGAEAPEWREVLGDLAIEGANRAYQGVVGDGPGRHVDHRDDHGVCPRNVILVIAGITAPHIMGRSAMAIDKSYAGTWKANIAKSKYEPGPGPKESTAPNGISLTIVDPYTVAFTNYFDGRAGCPWTTCGT